MRERRFDARIVTCVEIGGLTCVREQRMWRIDSFEEKKREACVWSEGRRSFGTCIEKLEV
jgi:hypothetical protein